MSQIPSKTDLQFITDKALANEIDKTGQTEKVVETAQQINSLNPKSTTEKRAGNLFYDLLQNKPKDFFILGGIIALILFVLGARLKYVRQYGRSFF